LNELQFLLTAVVAAHRESELLTMQIPQGHWLGIDVGSSRGKVFNFCLVTADQTGQVSVFFEVGAVRGPAQGLSFPSSDAGAFDDLTRATLLSEAAEAGALQILKESALVKDWLAARELGNGVLGVCIDAPCGFAVRGSGQRDTEAQGVGTFRTPPLEVFLRELTVLCGDKNHTPLRQRFFWKLIGQVAFRYFVVLSTSQPFEMSIPVLTASCMTGEQTRVREGFPSDTYKRSNGTVGVLGSASRDVLFCVGRAEWVAHGNQFNGRTSVPPPGRMSALRAHQQRLLKDLQQGCALPAMQKIPNDPAWGDLWDAFTCAFVSCCDAQGCGCFVCSDVARSSLEGAILRPK
jgi:hypothetical protein